MTDSGGLTAAERAKPYAKYFDMTYPEPAGMTEIVRQQRPIQSAEALPVQKINDMLVPGTFSGETGYCVMPDGSGYVGLDHEMPGSTPEMIRWWFAWFITEDLRYKIWFPRDHFGTDVSWEDRKMLSDPTIPLERKLQIPPPGHLAVEAIGGGVDKLQISRISPVDFGFDESWEKSTNVATIICGNVVAPPQVPGGCHGYVALLHFVQEVPGGVIFKTRFWMGYQIVERKPVLMLPYGAAITEKACYGLFEHDVTEGSRLGGFLPQLYREEKGQIV